MKTILETKFPDDTCQLIAVKSILGIEIAEDEPTIPDPTDPSTDPVELNDAPFWVGHSGITSCISYSQSYYI